MDFFEDFKTSIEFFINSEHKILEKIDPKITVLQYLRDNGYTGTKYGCGEGGCGACTVVIAEYDHDLKLINYRSANSCLLPLCAMNQRQIITIEGIGNPEKPHPIQKRFAEGHATQCGYCTPGIIMSFYSFLKLNPNPIQHDIEESFDGNLCRCTGYRSILDVAKTFASDNKSKCSEENCSSSCSKMQMNEYKSYDSNLDLPFPTCLIDRYDPRPVVLNYENCKWFEPSNLNELLKVKSTFPNAKLVGGNTEIGVEMNIRSINHTILINMSRIKELTSVEIIEKSNGIKTIEIGANSTLSSLVDSLKKLKSSSEDYHESLLDSFLSNLKWFASRQIRNFATLAGNIVTGSPISDLNPILVANNATLTILSQMHGQRVIPIRKFFKGYRVNDMKQDEVLVKVSLDLPTSKFEYVRAYKQAKRKDDDIAIVNACFRVKLDSVFRINELDLSFGGLATTTILIEMKNLFKGALWGNEKNLELIHEAILNEIKLSYSVPGSMPTYRRCLAVSFFTRFWYQVIRDFNIKIENKEIRSLENLEEIERNISKGTQDFDFDGKQDPFIGTTNPHLSGLKQSTGNAKYLDDIPKQVGELYGILVLSTKAHAYIKNIDASEALKLDGVYDFVTYKDIKHNIFGPIRKDEEFFAEKEVLFVGQTIGVIVAETKSLAKQAANLVKIEYEPLDEVITIEDAIEKNSFYDYERTLQNVEFGSEEWNCGDNEVVFEGQCRIGAQEHFYLEPQCCLVIPKNEDNEIEIISSTQNLTETQREVSIALGIPYNRIVCHVKRLGGGFGGKETRSVNLAVTIAAAAKKVGRPVRCILDRDIDMLTSGNRHPFLGKYKIKVTKDGYFKAYELNLISNAGHSFDLSTSIMERALTHCDNVYKFPKLRARGRLAKTNIASNTAFRGFGGPQGMMVTEMMIDEVAEKLNLDPVEIRKNNFYKPNDITHYNLKLDDWYVPDMWQQILDYTNYKQKRKEIDEFNIKNKWKKRGLAITPTKFGLSFTARFLNQANSLVHIYTDGSVLLSHGGVEMGQGLHTKMIQIAANTLKVPIDKIYIAETSTDKCPNTSPTAASVSSDINGMAVMEACKVLYERLEPYRNKNPNGNIGDWALAAYFDRVYLSANGFYKTPDVNFDWETNTGRLYFYFTSGVAVSSVELDTLTGDYSILKADIIMDIGKPINYSIDIGQIEGGFMQGVGWCTSEEVLVLTSNGSVLTRGPGNYKIPSFRDVPVDFNVKILRDKEYKNLKTIKSSKGIGEPPLFLGACVYFALRNAVVAARKANGINEPLSWFPSPCTVEVLRLACADSLVVKSKVEPKSVLNKTTNKYELEKLWAVRP